MTSFLVFFFSMFAFLFVGNEGDGDDAVNQIFVDPIRPYRVLQATSDTGQTWPPG